MVFNVLLREGMENLNCLSTKLINNKKNKRFTEQNAVDMTST